MSRRDLRRTALTGSMLLILIALFALTSITTGRGQVEEPAPAGRTDGGVRNVILLIADGCGFNHLQAANLYEHGDPEGPLYAAFPLRLAMATFMADGGYDPALAWAEFDYVRQGATDSAAAATAMACGVKTYAGAIGVDRNGQPVTNVVERAERLGKATGVVTSVPLSHATPAGFVAHTASRSSYEAIAGQMIHESALEVIMGAGHPEYDNNGRRKEGEPDYRYVGGEQTWAALCAGTAGGDADGDGVPDPWTLVESVEDFRALQEGDAPARVIGVARVADTLQQRRDADPDSEEDEKAAPFAVRLNEGVPTLAEMTRGALNVLDGDPDGLFLMIEGGAVDWAAHANQSGRVIEEQVDFNRAVQAVVEWVEAGDGWGDTLVVVTADHETGYLTGPGSDPAWQPLVGGGAGVAPQMEWHSAGHTNSLVPLFARGGRASDFRARILGHDPVRGPYLDNTTIAAVIIAALR
ncbi:MAG: alkaline phosphatase [Armatimonadota bacterium]